MKIITILLLLLFLVSCSTSTGISQGLVDERNLQTLEQINEYVNSFESEDDRITYGSDDYWASYKEFKENGKGDCEDYSIAKAHIIVKNGLATANDILLIHVKSIFSEPNIGHVILYVNGVYLDNLFSKPFLILPPHYVKRGVIPYFSVADDEALDTFWPSKRRRNSLTPE